MSNFLLALWAAFIGADRIDLLGGSAAFVLTPFLALTPFVLMSELWRARREGRRIRISRTALIYATVASALVTVVLASVFVAADTQISASRALLLVADAGGTFVIALLCVGRPDAERALARGAIACLSMFVVFDVVEALWWIGRAAETMRFGSVVISFGGLQNVGPVPRLAGPVSDANRGGFVLLLYTVLIARGEPRGSVRRVALAFTVILLLATISRSAVLGAIATAIVALLTQEAQRARVSLKTLVATGAIVAAATVFFLVQPRLFTSLADTVTSPLTERLSASEGSAKGHLALIERGLDEATESVPRAMIGLGYGNSHLVLQDVFPGSKYGNFHSLYVSLFVEAGVVALLLMLVLMLTPLVAGGPWRPLIVGAVVFNVFYQTPTEPAFWFALAAAWITFPGRPRRQVHFSIPGTDR